MKILHITNNYPTLNFPIFGIFIKEQIESLNSLGVENEVFFINSREEGKGAYFRAVWKLRRLLKKNRYDIIHCHHSFSGVILMLSGRWFRTRRLLSYQSDPRNEGGRLLFRILSLFFNKIILKNKPEGGGGMKIVHQPNGVNTGFFMPMDKLQCKEKLGLDKANRYVLFMDSYNRRPCKRIDRYSKTLDILREKYHHEDLEPLVLTNTARALIPSYINSSDLHLLTSDFEGSPNSVKECLACNIPVVSTPVGNVADLLFEVEGSFVAGSFDPEELAELSDRSLSAGVIRSRESITRKGLNIEAVARNLLDLYRNMAGKPETGEATPENYDVQLSSAPVTLTGHHHAEERPMKILLINNCHYRRGGADVVYLNTGELLESRGHDVAYFSTKSQYNYPSPYSDFFVKDIDVFSLKFVEQLAYMPRKLYSRQSARNLQKVISLLKPDLAHIHLYKGGLTASILPVLRKSGIPTVLTLHDYSLLCPRNIMIDGKGNICERCLTATRLNCIYHRCNRNNLWYSIVNYAEYMLNNEILNPKDYFRKIICVSKFNYLKHSLHPLFGDRFIHLYNFYPLLSQSNPNTNKGDYLLFYGRLAPEKGVMTLINTWKRLPWEVRLKIIGDGAMTREIKDEIQKYNLSNVEFLGFREGDELFDYIRNASFILVPSEWYENNPLTIVEAYSVGKPVIGSNIGGIPELIIEGKTGYLFNMGDSSNLEEKIKMAVSMDDNEYVKMSETAYRFACSRFSEKEHYHNLMNIYRQATGKGVQ